MKIKSFFMHAAVSAHKAQMLALLFWSVIVASYWYYANSLDLTPWEIIKQTAHLFMDTAVGMLLFVLVFSVQPLVLFPSSANQLFPIIRTKCG